MTVNLIRHGSTLGNLQKRYIGVTDEPLCEVGITELRHRSYPPCDRVYSSPMRRCVQTAKTIYPNRDIVLVDGFRECNFGDFEAHNYIELSTNPDYQAWIDSGGTLPFPNGESREAFARRSYVAFQEVVSTCGCDSISLVVHGGTIMAIMERLVPNANYFDFQTSNGECVSIKL